MKSHLDLRLKKCLGFTLIELMIVIIIIGILASVGVPMYLGYVKDAKVASAKSVITIIVNSEKVYNQRTGTFINVSTAEFEGVPANNPLRIDVRDATQFWTLVVDSANDTGFDTTATGKEGTDYADTTVKYEYHIDADDTWFVDGVAE